MSLTLRYSKSFNPYKSSQYGTRLLSNLCLPIQLKFDNAPCKSLRSTLELPIWKYKFENRSYWI